MRITDFMLAQYLEISEKIKELESQKEVIAIGIKANGGANTENHLAVCLDQQRRNVAPISAFEEEFGKGWLEKHDLINVSKWTKVVVTEKPQKKVRHG